jgi:hypothetical protein
VFVLLYVLGFLSLALGIGVFVLLARTRRLLNWNPKWLLLTIPMGLILGVDAAHVCYRLNPFTRVLGFPFPSTLIERHLGSWFDFPGPTTNYEIAANVFIGLAVPHAILLAVAAYRAKRRAADRPEDREILRNED